MKYLFLLATLFVQSANATYNLLPATEIDYTSVLITAESPAWGRTGNSDAMTTVFGDSYNHYNFTDEATDTFNTNNNFVFIDGSDFTNTEFNTFLGSNKDLMEDWVFDGGRLFLNAAPNEGAGGDFGFGITFNYIEGGSNNDFTGKAVDTNHTIFDGPHGDIPDTITGNFFSHGEILADDRLNLLITSDSDDSIILAEMVWGNGLVIFGTMTDQSFHDNEALQLKANIIDYTLNSDVSSVPVPAAVWFMITGMIGLLRFKK
jgi:hypothetical protein